MEYCGIQHPEQGKDIIIKTFKTEIEMIRWINKNPAMRRKLIRKNIEDKKNEQ